MYTSSIITDLVKHQKEFPEKKLRKFLVLDNCFYQAFELHPEFMSCYINNRALRLSIIITESYGVKMNPKMMANTDYIFILRENLVTNKKRLYELYAGMFPTLEIFCQVMDQCTEDYECLVIDNTSRSNLLEDRVFCYNAP